MYLWSNRGPWCNVLPFSYSRNKYMSGFDRIWIKYKLSIRSYMMTADMKKGDSIRGDFHLTRCLQPLRTSGLCAWRSWVNAQSDRCRGEEDGWDRRCVINTKNIFSDPIHWPLQVVKKYSELLTENWVRTSIPTKSQQCGQIYIYFKFIITFTC